jgi:hypothetical protein
MLNTDKERRVSLSVILDRSALAIQTRVRIIRITEYRRSGVARPM